MDIKIHGGINFQTNIHHPIRQNAFEKEKDNEMIQKSAFIDEYRKDYQKYNYEDAIMDLETIKKFLYMIAGIPYAPKN